MMTASSSGYLDTGEFVFINVDLFRKCPQYGNVQCQLSKHLSSLSLKQPQFIFLLRTQPFSSNLLRPWFSPKASKEENEIARNAFQHVLTISSSKSVNGNFNQFKQKVCCLRLSYQDILLLSNLNEKKTLMLSTTLRWKLSRKNGFKIKPQRILSTRLLEITMML